MRRLAILSVCLLALVPAFDAAAATSKGTVERSWISTTSGGASAQAVLGRARSSACTRTSPGRRPRRPVRILAIEWHDPAGALRARWKDKTIKADKKGTRLYAWIASGVVKGKAGSWKAVLTVGGKPISTSRFRVVA